MGDLAELEQLARELQTDAVAPPASLDGLRARTRRRQRIRRVATIAAVAAVVVSCAALAIGALDRSSRQTVKASETDGPDATSSTEVPAHKGVGPTTTVSGGQVQHRPTPADPPRSTLAHLPELDCRSGARGSTAIDYAAGGIAGAMVQPTAALALAALTDVSYPQLTPAAEALLRGGSQADPNHNDTGLAVGPANSTKASFVYIESGSPKAIFTAQPLAGGWAITGISSCAESLRPTDPDQPTPPGPGTAVPYDNDVPVVGRGGQIVGHIHNEAYNNSPSNPPYARVYDDREEVVGVLGPEGFIELADPRERGLLERATR